MKGETPGNFFEFTIAEKRWKMHTFDWIILVNMQTLENIIFSVFKHINLPGKFVFSAVNSSEYVVVHSEMPMNERKTRRLPCVNRAVNAGK